ncbi:MAG TPA: PaaI family thioesterase [Clostridia bacterium]|jgi:acyl-CoA thioesterase|nr:PaaI family thioesterase [Clostridia bacterium]
MEDKIIKFFEGDKFAAYNGIKLIKVKPGYSLARMEITANHLNGVNIVQGGALFTLGDLAAAAAANAHGRVAVAISANILFIKPSKGKVLFAEAKEISASKKIANYQVDIYDDKQEDIAKLTVILYKRDEKIIFE